MASWGPKLYQDDVAVDVKNYFKDQLKRGKIKEEITNELIQHYQDVISDDDDAPIFWFALADTQWNLGRLLPVVKEHALKWISDGSNLKRWEKENSKEAKVRKRVLEELQQKLNSPLPPEKKIAQYKLYKCQWNIGDVFAYKLKSEYANEKGLLGNYLLIQKIDEYIWHPGHIIPVVYWRITEKLPITQKDVEDSEYIIHTKYDGLTYRRKMISTSNRIIPKDLMYIGNFQNLKLPCNELIRKDKISIPAIYWKELEVRAINGYLRFNLNQTD